MTVETTMNFRENERESWSEAFFAGPPRPSPPGALHYPQLGIQFRPIPKGLRPPAQGCEARATLGGGRNHLPTPTGLRSERHSHDTTPLGLSPVPSRFPRVARASQPLALSQNPVGIQLPAAAKLLVIHNPREGRGEGEFYSASHTDESNAHCTGRNQRLP